MIIIIVVKSVTQHTEEAHIIKEEVSQEAGKNNASDINAETEGQKAERVTGSRETEWVRHDVMTLRLTEKGE